MLTEKAQTTLAQLHGVTKSGTIKKMAKEVKKDHALAMELWSTAQLYPRMLSVLIMDKKQLTQEFINILANDLLVHDLKDRNQISEWLLANQLMKNKNTKLLLDSWEHNNSAVLRRLFWYYQARLRWTGQTPPDNTERLMESLEKNLAQEEPEVQWTMNFTAGQIGIFDPQYRSRCIVLGESLGLYKDDLVAKNCTPAYLPEFIRIEVAKKKQVKI